MRRRKHPQLIHFGVPALFLLAVTIFVLILRAGLDGGESATTGKSAQKTRATTTTTSTGARTVTTRLYTIQSGDTLGSIAIRFDIAVEDIVALNPGIEPTALRVGQKIKVGTAPASESGSGSSSGSGSP